MFTTTWHQTITRANPILIYKSLQCVIAPQWDKLKHSAQKNLPSTTKSSPAAATQSQHPARQGDRQARAQTSVITSDPQTCHYGQINRGKISLRNGNFTFFFNMDVRKTKEWEIPNKIFLIELWSETEINMNVMEYWNEVESAMSMCHYCLIIFFHDTDIINIPSLLMCVHWKGDYNAVVDSEIFTSSPS